MKKTMIIMIAALALFSCKKDLPGCYEPDEDMIEATLDIDCTGKYLITKAAILKICTAEDFDYLEDGDEVYVAYSEVYDCEYYDPLILCEKQYAFDRWISVSSIKAKSPKLVLERDCTGTYLDLNGLDYKVCNSDKLKDVEEGALIEVDFKELDECSNPDNVAICMMAREYHGVIKVKSFKVID